jgi:hypothetical protein
MWQIVLLSLVAMVLAQGDPLCPLFTVVDPTSGAMYTYDLSLFKVPDNYKEGFIQGKEELPNPRVAYLNVCGNARVVGCSSNTPVCQDDAAGNFWSLGTSASWTMTPYFDPKKGPNFPQYDRGIAVWIGGGPVRSVSSVVHVVRV